MRRRGAVSQLPGATPLRFAYADPPYPGMAARFYRHEPTYAGEVDFPALVSSLEQRRQLSPLQARHLDGWALSTSARSLATVLPLCPPDHRVCPWVKPHGAAPLTWGLHNVWEPVIVVGGRPRRPGMPDALVALPARGGGTLPGRKPIAFWAWLFNALGMLPDDAFDDLFPGTGIGAAAWAELSLSAGGPSDPRTAVAPGVADAGSDG